MATYIHQTPGRVRVQITELKHNEQMAEALGRHLSRVPGMQRVCANAVTGSLKLYFDDQKTCSWEILSILRQAGLLGNLLPFPRSPKQTEQRTAPIKLPKVRISPEARKILFQLATIAVTALVERSVSRISATALKGAL